ncbi:MAG: Gfo/Idh/MocA family oxidoreductase [Verrucomicrobiota bacterium]
MALIGAGGFGAYHVRALELLARENIAALAAVADPALDTSSALHARLAGAGVRVYPDYREMLAREPQLEAVTIAAPVPFHFEMVEACARRGLPVYLEKPPVPLLAELEGLIKLDPAQRVHVGFQLIHSAWAQQIKGWIAGGKLGDIRHIRACACWPRTDAYYNRAAWAGKLALDGRAVLDGPATNALSHLIHTLLFLASPVPGGYDEPVELRGELYRVRPIESYDTAALRGTLKSRSRAEFSVAVTHATRKECRYHLRITGTKGWAHVSDDGRRLESSLGDFSHAGARPFRSSSTRTGSSPASCGAGETRPPISLADTRSYLRVTNALFGSARAIHTIDSRWVRTYRDKADIGFDVPGLHDATLACFETGKVYSELGTCPWARASEPVDADEARAFDWTRLLRPAA